MIKETMKSILPKYVQKLLYRLLVVFRRFQNRNKSTKEIFSNIYKKNQWGGECDFYSGEGSDDRFSKPYCSYINEFLSANFNDADLKVIDLGCGDFRVGQKLLTNYVDYIGIDIVPDLIKRNNEKFSSDTVEFFCLDIVDDELPNGDVCLIRQVFQHLSNAQIKKVLHKLSKYKFIFVTEHYPVNIESAIKNIDKPAGGDIRFHNNSAVFLDHEPFNMVNIELVFSLPHDDWGTLQTFLISN